MMMLPDAGERALGVLKNELPWLADRAIPEVEPEGIVVALKLSGEWVAFVCDKANDTVRELSVPASMVTQPERMLFGAERALTAPWN